MKALRKSKFTPVFGLIIGVAIGLICFRLTTVTAGNLEPMAAPEPTMKTLDEVEPRIPIPASASSAATYTISTSGSYYLTGDRSCNGTGIIIEADNVTIDLCGYCLIGPGIGINYGIYIYNRQNVQISNGTITNFGNHGIFATDNFISRGHGVLNVRTTANGGSGIYLMANSCLIKDCICSENAGKGVYVYSGSIVTGTSAYDNTGYGIETAPGCTIQGNTVYKNDGRGIYASTGSSVIGNTSRNNGNDGIYILDASTVTCNTVISNDGAGILALDNSMILNNTVFGNNSSNETDKGGIYVSTNCTVKGNTLAANRQNNIYSWNPDNVIEENTLLESTYGIYFNGAGCFYANNRASDNTTANYGGDVPAGAGDGGGNASF